MPHNHLTSLPTSFPRNSTAKELDAKNRQEIALKAISKQESVSQISREHSVSRKFVYAQQDKASQALTEVFNTTSHDSEVLYYIPVTKQWIEQVILSLTLTCHSSYGGAIEFLKDTMDLDRCKGTISNIIHKAIFHAERFNKKQDLSGIDVGAHDEIFQNGEPVLVGCDVHSTYIYLLSLEEHRDGDTWGTRLLELSERGLHPSHTIADGGKGLRCGQKEAWPDVPCRGDVFHPLHDMGKLCSYLENKAFAAIGAEEKLGKQMIRAKKKQQGNKLSKSLAHARAKTETAINLYEDISSLATWLREDIFPLSGPELETRHELLHFVVEELQGREVLVPHRIGPVRRQLANQGRELLLFAEALEDNLFALSHAFKVDISVIRRIQALQATAPDSNSYWEESKKLYKDVGPVFKAIEEAIKDLLKQTVRASSIVENVNSRLRNYFFLRKTLGRGYLDLLQFFLNHRCFSRSHHPERVGKSPVELLTGEKHPHWLELLGYTRFKRPTKGYSELVAA